MTVTNTDLPPVPGISGVSCCFERNCTVRFFGAAARNLVEVVRYDYSRLNVQLGETMAGRRRGLTYPMRYEIGSTR